VKLTATNLLKGELTDNFVQSRTAVGFVAVVH
jgi:hypothetical protein